MYSIFNDGHGNLSFARSDTYTYDANGNMTCRVEGGQVFVQAYNAENRLSNVSLVSGTCASPGNTQQSWTFAYDGDGTRVSQVYFDGTNTQTTLYFFGGLYETTVETSAVKKYYAIAGQVVAMNDGNGMQYLLTDHLGSVVAVTNASGSVLSQTRYLPFGQVRTDQYAPGTITQTDFAYTGQRNVASLKLMDYNARFYDASLGRFIQPDTLIPGAANPQTWNRYSYVYNDPINLMDPSGHGGHCGDQQSGYSCGQRLGKQADINEQGRLALAARRARSVFCSANPEVCIGSSHAAPTPDLLTSYATRGSWWGDATYSCDARCLADTGGVTYVGLLQDPAFYAAVGFGCIVSGLCEMIAPAALPMVATECAETPACEEDATSTINALTEEAEVTYPKLAGFEQLHHIFPKYLGGDPYGAVVRLNAAYHQLITNAFREAWAYGQGAPGLDRAQQIIEEVYMKFPLP